MVLKHRNNINPGLSRSGQPHRVNQYQWDGFESFDQFRIAHTLNREFTPRRRLIFEPLGKVSEGVVVVLLSLRLGEVDLSVEVAVLERP